MAHIKLFTFIGFITVSLVESQQQLPVCPPSGMHVFPFLGLCDRFVRCIFGEIIIQVCQPGLEFDVRLATCNLAEIANCNPCQSNPLENVIFFRDEQDCERFTMCTGTKFSEHRCPTGLYFNPDSNTCDVHESVSCPNSPGPDAPCNNEQEEFEFIASPRSCARYTICASGNSIVRYCPSGLIYDVVTQSCNTRAEGICLADSTPVCPSNTIEQIAHPFDCRYYADCNNGNRRLNSCPPGLEVNRRTNQCDLPHIAQCSSPQLL